MADSHVRFDTGQGKPEDGLQGGPHPRQLRYQCFLFVVFQLLTGPIVGERGEAAAEQIDNPLHDAAKRGNVDLVEESLMMKVRGSVQL